MKKEGVGVLICRSAGTDHCGDAAEDHDEEKITMSSTMKVYVVIPDNDRGKNQNRITVRTTPVPGFALAGPKRDCAVIHADLSRDAARKIAEWYEEHKDDEE